MRPTGGDWRRILLGSGVLAAVVYAAANVLGALRWDGYSTLGQTVSELSALGAPSRPLVVPLLVLHGLLALAFALGVWQSRGSRGFRVMAALLIALGVVDLVSWLFPMHLREDAKTLTDTLHIAVTVVTSVLILAALAFGAAGRTGGFRRYSIVTLGVCLVFGALTALDGPKIGAGEPTPWAGLTERIGIGAYLAWMSVLAVLLWPGSPPASRPQGDRGAFPQSRAIAGS